MLLLTVETPCTSATCLYQRFFHKMFASCWWIQLKNKHTHSCSDNLSVT